MELAAKIIFIKQFQIFNYRNGARSESSPPLSASALDGRLCSDPKQSPTVTTDAKSTSPMAGASGSCSPVRCFLTARSFAFALASFGWHEDYLATATQAKCRTSARSAPFVALSD